jgi:hypothetical protein
MTCKGHAMKRLFILIALVATLTFGCSTAMVPVGSNTGPGDKLALEVIVGQKLERFERRDPFTPIHVTFRNLSNRRIHLKYSQFALVDPAGRRFIVAPVDQVVDWLRYDRWYSYYGPYYPEPIGRYVFREGWLKPGRELQAVIFFHQATRFGQGVYNLRINIPENQRPLEFQFKLY